MKDDDIIQKEITYKDDNTTIIIHILKMIVIQKRKQLIEIYDMIHIIARDC